MAYKFNPITKQLDYAGEEIIIYKDLTSVEIVNSSTKTDSRSFTCPKNVIGTNNALLIEGDFDFKNNSGGNANYTITVAINGADVASSAMTNFTTQSTRRSGFYRILLKGAGATNSQTMNITHVFSTLAAAGTYVTPAIDTTQDFVVTIRITLSVQSLETSYIGRMFTVKLITT